MTSRTPAAISAVLKWSALIGILLVGAFLRFYQLEYKSLWVDEIIQVSLAQQGFWETIQGMRTQVAAPPLDYLVTWLMLQAGRTGIVTSEFVLRFPAVVWGVLTIVFGYVTARRLTRSTLAAVLTAYLIALAPLLVRFSQEARFYALSTLLMVALVYFFGRAWENPNAKNWTWFALTLLLAFFTHYYTAFVLVVLLAYAVMVAAVEWWRTRGSSLSAPLRGRLGGLGAALAVCAVGIVPWLLYAQPAQTQQQTFAVASIAEVIGEPVTSGHVGGAWHLYAVRGLGLAVFPALALLGVMSGARKKSRWSIVLAIIVLAGAGGVLFLDWKFRYFFTSRQLLFLVPFYLVLAAMGLVACYQWLARRNRIVAALGVLAALGGITVIFLLSARAYYDWPKDDWRSAARLLVNAGAQKIFTEPDSLHGYLTYYQPALSTAIFPGATVDTLAKTSTKERAWIVTLEQPQPSVLQTLKAAGWSAIRLDVGPSLYVMYVGRASEQALWREMVKVDVPAQALVYSDLLDKSGFCEKDDVPLIVNARAALTPPTDPPLLDAQRALLRRKLRRLC